MVYQNPWDADKVLFGEKFIALKILEIRKVKKWPKYTFQLNTQIRS